MKWPLVKLGECCRIVSGSTPRREVSEYWDGDIPWATPKDVSLNKRKILATTAEKITSKGLASCSTNILPKGSILFSSRAPIGLVAQAGIEVCTNQGFKNLIPSEVISSDYLYYCMKFFAPAIEKLGNGATFKEVSKEIVGNFKIPLPPIKIQNNISNILDKLEIIKFKRQQALKFMDQLVKSRFVELFGEPANPKAVVEVKSLESVCERITDGTHQTPKYVDEGYIFISSKDVKTGYIDWKNVMYIPQELHDALYSRLSPQRNDILLAKNGTTGIAALVDTDEVFDIYVSLALLRPKVTVNSKYLLCAINNPATKRQFDAGLKGIGVPNLHLNVIRETKVLIPPLDLQNRFAEFAEAADKSKFAFKQSLKDLEMTYKALLQEYFG
ncbi:restriction modification system S chain-like protein [Deltaproteobacteria bacterium]|nr:restriction modification system S chain-like protein [Deltaproteobacteria bacterium]